jgi:hypothetical protein
MASNSGHTQETANAARYEIHVRGRLDERWSAWLGGLEMAQTAGGDTILSGPVADQSALHGLLARISDLNLTLVKVEMVEERT